MDHLEERTESRSMSVAAFRVRGSGRKAPVWMLAGSLLASPLGCNEPGRRTTPVEEPEPSEEVDAPRARPMGGDAGPLDALAVTPPAGRTDAQTTPDAAPPKPDAAANEDAAKSADQAGADDPRPNVVLVMTDDQGWGDVGYNGLEAIPTPNLDAMAAAGLRLDRFYAASPVCSPTRGSVLTGRHPNRYGTFTAGLPIRAQELTLAQVLERAGYATAHFGKWHLEGRIGPGQPIPADEPLGPGKLGFDTWLSASNFFDIGSALGRIGVPEPVEGDGSDHVVKQALAYVEGTRESRRPFFVVIWFGSPHSPHSALPADLAAAGGSAYYGELVAVDRAVGALRAGLRRMGLANNTLLWFNSDNGPTPADGSTGGLRGNKRSIWEGGVRVPCVVEWPARIQRPAISSVPAVTSDIYPTVLDAVGVKPADQVEPLDGLSLVPLFDGEMRERPRPIGFWNHAQGGALTRTAGEAAWRDNRYKLRREGDRFALYDLIADPGEQRDVAAQRPDITRQMRAALSAWQDSVLRSLDGADYR